jgi:UDP-3-O-[3-hydroxymyristoyl] glucosamine N-acyltransferase
MKIPVYINSVAQCNVDLECSVVNASHFVKITDAAPIDHATPYSVSFISSKNKNKEKLLQQSSAGLIICDLNEEEVIKNTNRCVIITKNPRLYFAKLLLSLQHSIIEYGIHPTAVINKSAEIGKNVQIGANVVIGKSVIGQGTIICPNVSIYDNVVIGDDVFIESGSVIGSSGFGFERDDNGVPIPFPQLGGVRIGNNVEIGANVCIDRSTLSDTIIGNNVKIDNLVHISHNNVIGDNTLIICGCFIAGSVTIGKNCWIAASKIINKVTIEDNVTVGLGSVVLDCLSAGKTYMGYPAREVRDYAHIQYCLNKFNVKSKK